MAGIASSLSRLRKLRGQFEKAPQGCGGKIGLEAGCAADPAPRDCEVWE
jgi:hypothetical protein